MFDKANVLHSGDLFFNKLFPYIDIDAGGSVEGYIQATRQMLEMIDDQTQIIPGHGELANKSDLQGFLTMMVETNDYVLGLKNDGQALEKILEIGLPEKWKAWHWNFITEERWIKTLFRGKS